MANAIVYCDQCGKMIAPKEMASGQVIITPTASICSACAGSLTAEQRAAILRLAMPGPVAPAAQGRKSPSASSSRGSARMTAATHTSSRRRGVEAPKVSDESAKKAKMAMAGIAGVVVVLIIAGVALMGREPAKPVQPEVPAPAAEVPSAQPDAAQAAEAPAPAPKAEGLAEIRGLYTPNLDNYALMVEKLQALLAENPENADVKAFLVDLEDSYGQLAARGLSRAERMARVQANGGDVEGALRRIDDALKPYEGSPWYQKEGEAEADRIRAEITRIGKDAGTGIGTTRTATNAVTNSHFENLDDRNRPIDWAMSGNVEVTKDHYGRFVLISQPRPTGSSFIEGRFELEPAWRELHISCHLKGENINPATGNDKAGLIVAFQDRDRKEIARNVSGAPFLTSSAEWKRYDMRTDIPEGAAYVHLRLGLFSTAGTLSVDHVFAGPVQARTVFVRPAAGTRGVPGPGDEEVQTGLSKADNIREAIKIAKAGNYARAKEFLANNDTWDRVGERRIASELMAAIEEAEKVNALGDNSWAAFVAGMSEAARKGLGESRRFIDNERRNVPDEHRPKLDLADRRQRHASLVRDMIVDGLRHARGFVRLDERETGRRISGRVSAVEGDKVTIAPSVGAPEVVGLASLSAESLITASSLNRTGVASPVQMASFAFFIGDFAHARSLADGADDESRAIVADIEMLALGAKPAPDFDAFLAKLEPDAPKTVPGGAQGPATELTIKPPEGPGPTQNAAVDVAPLVHVAAEPGGWPKKPLPGQMGLPGQWAPGLVMEIFAGSNFEKRYGTRIERGLRGLWGPITPDGDKVPALGNGYSVRWSGWILIPAKGTYVFTSGRGLRAQIDGKPISREGIEMEPGLYPVACTLQNDNNSSVTPSLSWAYKGMGNQVVPESHFYHKVSEYGAMGPPTKLVQGVWVEYFADGELGQKVFEGHVPYPDFNIPETQVLHPLLPPNKDFSLRYTSSIFIAEQNNGHLIRAYIDTTCGMRTFFNDKLMEEVGIRDRVTWDGRRVDASIGDAPIGQHKVVMEYWGRGQSMIKTDVTFVRPRDTIGYVSYRDVREDEKMPQPDRSGYAPGLQATFVGANRNRVEGLVPSLRLDYNKESPVYDIPGEAFRVSMEGFLLVPESGVYTITASYAGAITLVVGGRTVAADRADSGEFKLASAIVPLRAGAAPIKLTYAHSNGNSGITVSWAGPSMATQWIGNGFLAHRAKELTINKVPEKQDPQGVVVTGGSGEGAAKVWEIPQGNIFPNPSFETMGTDNLPRDWVKRNFGRGEYDVRIDARGETHTGQHSLRFYSTSEEAKAALVTRVKSLPPGRYEIKFWALPDIGQTAVVRVRLGDQEQAPLTVSGETFREYRQTLTVLEGMENVEVGFVCASNRVRLWLDDVEMTYIGK